MKFESKDEPFEAVFEAAPVAMILCSRGGVILRANRAARELCGGDLAGKIFGDAFRARCNAAPRWLAGALDGKRPGSLAAAFRRSNGKRVGLRLDAALLGNVSKKAAGCVLALHEAGGPGSAGKRAAVLDELQQASVERALEPRRLLDAAAKTAVKHMGDTCAIVLLGDEGLLEPAAFHAWKLEARKMLKESLHGRTIQPDEGLAGRSFTNDKVIILKDIGPEEKRYFDKHELPYIERFGTHSIAAAPVRANERTIGTIIVSREREGNPFGEEDGALLRDMADRIGLAVEKARVHEKLRNEIREKRKLRRLTRKQKLAETVLEETCIPLIVLDAAGRIVHLNQACRELYGHDTREVVGLHFRDTFLPPKEADRFEAMFDSSREGDFQKKGESSWKTKDGGTRLVSWSASAVPDKEGNIAHVVITGVDVTDARRNEEELLVHRENLEKLAGERLRKLEEQGQWLAREVDRRIETEKELRRAAGLLETVFSSIHPLIAYMDRDFNFIRVNRAYAAADGREPEHFLGRNHFELYPHEENERIFRDVVESGEPYHVYEKPFEYPQNPERGTSYWDWSLHPVKDEEGTVIGLVLCLIDVTERKTAQRESALLAAAVEAAGDAVIITDAKGFIVYANPAFELMTGWRREEVIGGDIFLLDGTARNKKLHRRMREMMRRRGIWRGRLESRKKDGTRHWEDCTITTVKDEKGKVTSHVHIRRDVTETLRLQSIAEAAVTMSNIGYVFSGIRHEIGNPVNSVKMALNVTKNKLEKGGSAEKAIDRCLEELAKVEYLLHSLKTFNMYEKLDLRSMEAGPFLEKFKKLVKSDFSRKGIDVAVEIGAGAEACIADPRALHQVLLNLVTNASDACEGRKKPRISIEAERRAEKVVIRVADNGRGMGKEELENMFRPFYTTKTSGTGLGLVLSKNLLSKMNGTIELSSAPGEGTVVEMTLPAPPRPEAAAAGGKDTSRGAAGEHAAAAARGASK